MLVHWLMIGVFILLVNIGYLTTDPDPKVISYEGEFLIAT